MFIARKELARRQAVKDDDEVVEWDEDMEAERKTASKAHKLCKLLLFILLLLAVKCGRVDKVNDIFGLGGFIRLTKLNAMMQMFDDGKWCFCGVWILFILWPFPSFLMHPPAPLDPLLRVNSGRQSYASFGVRAIQRQPHGESPELWNKHARVGALDAEP
jgi:hypothetical protein